MAFFYEWAEGGVVKAHREVSLPPARAGWRQPVQVPPGPSLPHWTPMESCLPHLATGGCPLRVCISDLEGPWPLGCVSVLIPRWDGSLGGVWVLPLLRPSE